MGTFKKIDEHTVESEGIVFKSKNNLGVVAAGNFLDKRQHWYDATYISEMEFDSHKDLTIELKRFGKFTGASCGLRQGE